MISALLENGLVHETTTVVASSFHCDVIGLVRYDLVKLHKLCRLYIFTANFISLASSYPDIGIATCKNH